ncbi:hypothetical protein [Bartonella gliris]
MLFSTALSSLSGYLGAYLANWLTLEFARRIYTHVLSLSLPVLRTWQVSKLFMRIGEVDTIHSFLTGIIATTVLNVLFAIIYLAVLFSISSQLDFFYCSYYFVLTNGLFSIGRPLFTPLITPYFYLANSILSSISLSLSPKF